MLKLISRFVQTTLKRANLHAAFCLVFSGFLRINKFIYNKVESNFSSCNLTWGFVSLSKDWLFIVIQSCTIDLFYYKITLIISVANDEACVVTFFNNLFSRFPKTNNHHLFINHVGTFSYNYITRKLQKRICALGYKGNYTSNSFKKWAATSTRLAGLSEVEIQPLRRWKSNCYCLYVETYLD